VFINTQTKNCPYIISNPCCDGNDKRFTEAVWQSGK